MSRTCRASNDLALSPGRAAVHKNWCIATGKVKSFEGDKMQSVTTLQESLWPEAMGFWESIPGNAITLLPSPGDHCWPLSDRRVSGVVWTDLVSLMSLIKHWDHLLLPNWMQYLTVAFMSVGFLLCTFNELRKKDRTTYIYWLNTLEMPGTVFHVSLHNEQNVFTENLILFFLIIQVLPNHFQRADSIRQISSCALSETRK